MGALTDFGLRDEPAGDGAHVVMPSGEIDALSAPALGSRLLSLVADEGKTEIVVDLSKVTFMDSTGIGVLLNALRSLASRGGRMVLVCPSERVFRPFQITGLVNKLQIARSREEAFGHLATAWP
jgi:anti-sigma B factor antagonist